MVRLPRVLVAAPASGHGKTTLATGLMAALTRRGLAVSGHKVGPDYIDPGYHALATGRPGRNLDPHLVGESLVVPLLLHGARGADVAVVEGVMGLFDGRVGGAGFASAGLVCAVRCGGAPAVAAVLVRGCSPPDPLMIATVAIAANSVKPAPARMTLPRCESVGGTYGAGPAPLRPNAENGVG